MNLAGCAEEIQHRLIHIFARDENGRRAVNGGNPKLNRDPHFRDYVHFYEVSWMACCVKSSACCLVLDSKKGRQAGDES